MRLVRWIVSVALFLALLAFSVNNQQDASIRWFFGYEWRTRMVFVVLATFTLGCAFGVLAMVPSWWRHRRVARRQVQPPASAPRASEPGTAPLAVEHPPRDGL